MEKKREFCLAVILSVIFSFGSAHIMFSLPEIIHQVLLESLPGFWQNVRPIRINVEILEGLKPIGYLVFICLLSLILVGIVAKRYKLAFLGSFSLYLPIFANFCYIMSIFAGLGLFRLLWYPLLDYYPEALEFGNIIILPVLLLALLAKLLLPVSLMAVPLLPVSLFSESKFILFGDISSSIMLIGNLLFLISIVTWLYGRFLGKEVIDFWVYRYSRHPQYLGFLIWSYGLTTFFFFWLAPGINVPVPTLFWLISALLIIGVAIQEENGMIQKYKNEYLDWRHQTPFLFPIPKRISDIIVAPVKILLKKDWPETEKDIVIVILFYGVILVSSSILINIFLL